jgi:hypothetical protein
VTDESPGDAGLLQLVDRDLACECAIGLVEDVLGGDFEALAEVLARGEKVEGWGSNDDLCCTQSNFQYLCSWILCRDVPTLESSLASLRFEMISLIDLTLPFLHLLSAHSIVYTTFVVLFYCVAYILKLPPTKN